MFDGFALRANSFVHLKQIESYASGHQVRFGSLNYVADIHRDLIFAGFPTAVAAPDHPDDHDLNLSSGRIQEIAPVTALALEPEQAAPSKDGRINPTMEAVDSMAWEPHMDLVSLDAYATGTPDSSPAIGSEPCEPADAELDRLSIFEFSAADIFQHSPLIDALNSLKSLSLAEDSQPNYIRLKLGADDGEFRFPPATHFIATVEDNDAEVYKDPVDTINDERDGGQDSPGK